MSEIYTKESVEKVLAGINMLAEFMKHPDRLLEFIYKLSSDLDRQVELNKQLTERLAERESKQGELPPWPKDFQGPFSVFSNTIVRGYFNDGVIYCPTNTESKFICDLLNREWKRRVAQESKGGAR